MENNELLEQMHEFLSGQVGMYEKILELSRSQQDYIRERDTQELMSVLGKKQALIRIVDEHSRNAAPLLKEWETGREQFSREDRAELERLHEQLVAILKELTAIEDAGQKDLHDKMENSGSQIAKMQTGKQMLRAYGVKPPVEGRVKDRKS